MQTFLPYPDFEQALDCLDYKRLGKQRVEAFQILRIMERKKMNIYAAWGNHPAVLMWEGYENALKHYMNTAIQLWKSRGYKNTMQEMPVKQIIIPPWLGDERLHASHRASLLSKNPAFYKLYGWKEQPGVEYFWPVTKDRRYSEFEEKDISDRSDIK
jgi:hypothetical protein